MGREAARQIPQELGLLSDRDLVGLVQTRGMAIARASERPHLPWEFHVVDSPVVNAFALPGGFAYLTRGILAHMNSEAEMAGVLGHEIGHITARHSAQQMSRAQLTSLGLGLGMVFVPEVRPFGDLLQGSLGLLFLKFGRDDESEADRLGVRYSLGQGYDPRHMAAFFGVLARMGERSREAGEVIPTWLSTHPDPADRGQKILALVRETAPAGANLAVGEESFKQMLEGLTFGDDPREGFMDGNVFKHPGLKFEISFPEGWRVENTRQRVLAGSNDAAFEMTASRGASNLDPQTQAARVFQSAGLQAGRGQSLRIGGFPAFVVPFRQQSQAGAIDGDAAFLRDGEMMYQIFAYTSPDRYGRMRNLFRGIFGSFSRLTDPADLNAQPQRIVLYRVPRATSAREALLASGIAGSQLEEMAIVNHVRLDDRVEAGRLLKSVTRPTIQSARALGEGNILGATREYSR